MTDDAASALATDLRRSVSAFVRAIRHQAGTEKSAQSDTLDLLHRRGPTNVATLAVTRGVTHQTMRVVVAQLEAAGLVRQDADTADRRSRRVSITPAGCDALVRGEEARARCIEEAIRDRLSADERALLRAAIPLLDRIATPPIRPATPATERPTI